MILNIAKKHLVISVRTPFNFFIYLAFPIILMLILGSAFSGMFATPEINGKVLVYSSEDSEISRVFSDSYKYLENFSFTTSDDKSSAIQAVENSDYDVLLLIESSEINMIYSEYSLIEMTIVETFIRTVLSKYNLNITLLSNNRELYLDEESRDYVKIESPNSQDGPGALDFYGVTILTMIMMYGAYVSSYSVLDERKWKTLERMSVSPLKKMNIFLGISLGSLIQVIIQTLLVIFIGTVLLKINYGTRYFEFYLILFSQSFMILTLGLFLAFSFKEAKVVDTIINISVQFSVFLGGGYFVLPKGGIIGVLSRFSPIYWINKGLFESIYSSSSYYIKPAIYIPLIMSLIFILLSVKNFKKGEE